MIIKNFDMFLWTLRILFGICLRCRDPVSFGFLNITRQTNGILDIKIIFMEQKEHLLCNWVSRE